MIHQLNNSDNDANDDNGEIISNGDSCNIGANGNNDDLKETMMIHRLNNGANGENNGANGDNGENNSNGYNSNIGANGDNDDMKKTLFAMVTMVSMATMVPMAKIIPMAIVATLFNRCIIIVSFRSSMSI